MRHHTQHKGITILITLILVGVFLGISAALMSVTLRQFQLSNIAYDSEAAFQAANAGMECALNEDLVLDTFSIPKSGPLAALSCMNVLDGNGDSAPTSVGGVTSGEEQLFEFTWGFDPVLCSQFSVYKFFSSSADVPLMVNGVDMRPGVPCEEDATCTVIQSRGYNVSCAEVQTLRDVVEREYTLIY